MRAVEYLVFVAKTELQVKEILDNAKYRKDKVVFICRLVSSSTSPVFEYEVIRLLAGKLTQPIKITFQKTLDETAEPETLESLVAIMNKNFPLPKPEEKPKPRTSACSRFFPPWLYPQNYPEFKHLSQSKKKNKLK